VYLGFAGRGQDKGGEGDGKDGKGREGKHIQHPKRAKRLPRTLCFERESLVETC
jgi:hypothetical protein